MLRIEHLSYSYRKDVPCLKDISFSLKKGRIGVLLGKNGSGKSTLRKCIIGFNQGYEGKAFYQDNDLSERKWKTKAKKIAYLPQKVPEFSLTVHETLSLGLLPYQTLFNKVNEKERIDEVVSLLSLEEFLPKNFTSLSEGEKQKVRIGKALIQGANLLVLDEPTSSLDIENQKRILTLRDTLAKEKGLSILLSLHDINLALKYGDDFFLLSQGERIYQGEKDGLTLSLLEKAFHTERKLHSDGNEKYITY